MIDLATPKKKTLHVAKAGSESQEQQALFSWWRIGGFRTFGLAACQLFAIPNGGKRGIATAARMKSEGVTAGIPDVFLAAPSGDKHGLFIELKRATRQARLSSAQQVTISILRTAGYECVVAHGWVAARQEIENYLKGGEQ